MFVFVLIVLFSTEAQVSSRVTHISLEAMIERSSYIIVAQRVKNSKDQTLHDVQEILFVRDGMKEIKEKTINIYRGYHSFWVNAQKVNEEARKKGHAELLGIYMDGYEPDFTSDEIYKMTYGDHPQPPMIFFLIHQEDTGYEQTVNDGFENISKKKQVMKSLKKLKNSKPKTS